jgi:hypothetical protein
MRRKYRFSGVYQLTFIVGMDRKQRLATLNPITHLVMDYKSDRVIDWI